MCLRNFKLVFLMTSFVLGGCVQNYAPSIPDGYSQPIYGVGYAVIEVQNGSSVEEKRLMAVKASKLEAYKSLVEQLYGQYVEVSGQMTNSRIGEEIFDLGRGHYLWSPVGRNKADRRTQLRDYSQAWWRRS